jgi:hypothetical protein
MHGYSGQRNGSNPGQDGARQIEMASHYSEWIQFKSYELLILGLSI